MPQPPAPTPPDDRPARIRDLERRIADLKKRLPKHSVPASMLLELEELEEELEKETGKSG